MTRAALGPGREFDRIRAIAAALGASAAALDDDCALLDCAGTLAVSTDLSIESVHFRRDWLSLAEIGWRAAAAALSDLAAEGATPLGLLAAVGVPAAATEADTVEVMRGVGDAAAAVGARVLGGDLTAAAQWLLSITVLGSAPAPVSRSGARPGDGLWVTGELGGARAALYAWRRSDQPAADARRAFAHPVPRIEAGRALAARGARAMIDLSDGLAGDAGHLAAASGVGIEIDLERLPVAPSVAAEAARVGLSPAEFAAQGGEDYELLAALPPEFDGGGTPVTKIGVVTAGTGVRLLLGGSERKLAGFDHFE